ncbi:MAG: hypothetical protein A3K18_09665 [Lentisphaerae bacterium RIFOXYA12_64_32]|nr:MAG: hypothetical protein A3K18_09665 [Lentisphaerae bacterium RIFOXYA12_64_32]
MAPWWSRPLGLLALVAASALPCRLHAANGAAPALRDVLVVDAGKNSTTIVLAEKPTAAAQFAALEMQYHLEKISGEKVPIAQEPQPVNTPVKIAVGATALGKSLGFPVDNLGPWEFLVAEKNGTIVTAGGDDPRTDKAEWGSIGLVFNGKPNGTCRAAFEFLEEFCGVHWYLPSEAGMVLPAVTRLVVRMGEPVRRRSDFRSTSFYPYQVNGNMFCAPDTPELTGDNVPDSDMEKWRRNLWTIPVTTKDMLPVVEVQRWLLRNKVGGEPYGPNHSMGNWITRFGPEHPDWFSWKTKEKVDEFLAKYPDDRERFNKFHEIGTPCLTAPGLFEQVAADARDYMDRQQGKGDPARKDIPYQGSQGRFFGIVMNDNYVLCQCPTCKPLYEKPPADCPLWGGASGKASFYLWDFANRVARELHTTHPDGWVGGIGYHDYMPPPRDFTLEPNVAVTICTYLGNWTPALRETAYGLIGAWRDQAKCQWIGLWEYFCYCSMSAYQPMFPKVCPRLLGEDVRKLYQMGVLAEFIEGEEIYRFKDAPDRGWAIWSNPIWLYLNVWIRFKLWDDTTRDVTRLLDDHYRLFYGPAAKPIQAFYERIENRVTDMSLRGPKTFNDSSSNRQMADFEYLFPPDVMAELRRAVDEASALAVDEPWKTRVGWVRMGFLEPQEKAAARYVEQKKKTAANRPREGVCYRLTTAPEIDGVGADAAWAALPAFFLNDWRTAAKPKVPTWFRIGFDDTALYFLVRCDDPNVAKLRAVYKDRDSDVYQDDCIEVHLTFDPDRQQRCQVLVNSLGTIQDFRHSVNEAGADITDLNWNCGGAIAAAKVDAQGYTVELKLPLAAVGGAAKPGALFYANICREKYSLADGASPDSLHAWCATQGGFSDAKYFGRIVLADTDGWRLFFNQETQPPSPVLYKAEGKDWIAAPDTITAVPEQDRVRFAMKCPAVAQNGRTYGGFTVALDPPVDPARFPVAEIAFRKPSLDVMLELVYGYIGDDGKDYSNYFLPSRAGEVNEATQVFAGAFANAWDKDKPPPKLIKSITVYGVVEGPKTPIECDFALEWLRVCKESLRPPQP